jgi:DNA-binding XRE family transcriptional regulator
MKKKILELKFKSRMTWRELADEIGVQSNTLHNWSNGFFKSIKPENEARLKECFKKFGVR